jgi:integrase
VKDETFSRVFIVLRKLGIVIQEPFLKTDKSFKTKNDNLKIILQKATLAFDELKFSGVSFTIHELVAKIKGYETKPALLIDFLQESLKKLKERQGVDITLATYYKYRRSLEHVRDFLISKYQRKNIALQKVDKGFLDEYFLYLRKEKNISHNTAIKYVGFLKAFLSPAIKSGLIKHDPFEDLRHKPKQIFKEVLRQEEINQIANAELPTKDLDRIRDIFLFTCYTGLAYSDVKQLKSEHIVLDNDHSLYIRKPRQKTGQESIIPLLPPALRILKKYTLTGNLRDISWYVSSNQKMNKRLKAIAEHAGLKKGIAYAFSAAQFRDDHYPC